MADDKAEREGESDAEGDAGAATAEVPVEKWIPSPDSDWVDWMDKEGPLTPAEYEERFGKKPGEGEPDGEKETE